jgi:hypothetical protein
MVHLPANLGESPRLDNKYFQLIYQSNRAPLFAQFRAPVPVNVFSQSETEIITGSRACRANRLSFYRNRKCYLYWERRSGAATYFALWCGMKKITRISYVRRK